MGSPSKKLTFAADIHADASHHGPVDPGPDPPNLISNLPVEVGSISKKTSLAPPDGGFVLIKYRTGNVLLPLDPSSGGSEGLGASDGLEGSVSGVDSLGQLGEFGKFVQNPGLLQPVNSKKLSPITGKTSEDSVLVRIAFLGEKQVKCQSPKSS